MIAVAIAMMIAASIILVSKHNKNAGSNMLPVVVQSLKMPDGWGYELLLNNKPYIRQDYIPAIPGYKRFQTEAEALLIANKVVEKLKQGHTPTITIQEINNAHIHY